MRVTLLALIALVAVAGILPTLSSIVGVQTPSENTSIVNLVSKAKTCDEINVRGVSVEIQYPAPTRPAVYCTEVQNVTGWTLLQFLDLKPEGTLQYPTGFLCRLNSVPSKAQQSCDHTPLPSEGTWAYFYATTATGDHWQYSPVGSAVRKPQCGDFEGWLFVPAGQSATEAKLDSTPHPFACKK